MDAPQDPLPQLVPRAPDSHKGTFGTALVIGGSRGMSGAVSLSGMSALRGGAGLVRLAVPDRCLEGISGFEPSYMTSPLVEDDAGRIEEGAYDRILELAASATVVACGPGLGRSDGLTRLIGRLYQDIQKPMVVDADALNALAAQPEILGRHPFSRIFTPHPGEFARLSGKKLTGGDLEAEAIALAARTRTVIVLKSHRTLVTDGLRHWHNWTGNPGMATGGSGDVLTGLITALGCQGLEPYDSARLGVYLHGLAGDMAARELGEVSLIASDLIRFLSHAIQAYQRTEGDCTSDRSLVS